MASVAARPAYFRPEIVRITILLHALAVAQSIFNCREFLSLWLIGPSTRMMVASLYPLSNDIEIALMIAVALGLWWGHRWAWWTALVLDGNDCWYAVQLVYGISFAGHPVLAGVLQTATSVAGFVLLLHPEVRHYYRKSSAAVPAPNSRAWSRWLIDPPLRHAIALMMMVSPAILLLLTGPYIVIFLTSPLMVYVIWGACSGWALRHGGFGARLGAFGWHLAYVIYRQMHPLSRGEAGSTLFAWMSAYAMLATLYLAATCILRYRHPGFGKP